MAENNTELQGKIRSCVTVKIKESHFEYEIPKQYLISIIQTLLQGQYFYNIYFNLILSCC